MTRVPGLYEEGARTSSRACARLRSGAPARELLRPRKWNAVAQAFAVQIAARRPPFRAAATHREGRLRNRSFDRRSGVKALLAREDRQLVGCVRASNSVAEVGERRRAQRSVLPVARGCVDGSPTSRFSKEIREAQEASITSTVVAKPWGWGGQSRMSERASPGRRSSRDGRHSRSILRSSVHAGGWVAVLAALMSVCARASHERGGGDRSVRGKASTRHDGKRTPVVRKPRISQIETGKCSPPKRIALSWNRRLLDGTDAQAHDAERTNDARVLVRRSEMADVGPTHRALRRRVPRKVGLTA